MISFKIRKNSAKKGETMIYQKLLVGPDLYRVCPIDYADFPVHSHYEIELIYCMRGTIDVITGSDVYRLANGEAILIDSMVPHTYKDRSENNLSLLVELGPGFLRDHFRHVTKNPFNVKLYKKDEIRPEMIECLNELYERRTKYTELSTMLIMSNLYKLYSMIVSDISKKTYTATEAPASVKQTKKIDGALELVHQRYSEPITLEDAAAACGYGKSSFCKMFKQAVGVSFHQYLNDYRIENAKYLLSDTNMSIENVADTTGFRDTKIFCRVFKQATGTSPGKYRSTSKL